MEQKLLVVVSIIAGRNFPRRPECSLEIEARFNGEVLSTDPLPHSGGSMVIDNELAWEMTRKALQQHKLNRTPIKLQCYAVDGTTKNRQNVGYVMLDLRTAHPKSQQLQEPNWYGVLNSAYSRLRPQLQIALTLEEEGQSSSPMPIPKQIQAQHDTGPSLSLTLDASGGYYHLLPSLHSAVKPELKDDQVMHTLSLTLSNAKLLPELPQDQVQFYFYYCLLGNDITSEPFTPPTFAPERASIRLKSSRDLLSLLFASQPDLEVHLCSGTDSVAKGTLSLNSLATSDSIKSSLKLNPGGTSVDVTLQLEHFDELKLPTPSSQAPPTDETHPPQPSSATGVASSSGANVNATPPSGSRSARRNLTRSFEEASLSTPSTKGTAGPDSAQSTPPPPPTTTTGHPQQDRRETSLTPPPDSAHPNSHLSPVVPQPERTASQKFAAPISPHQLLSLPPSTTTATALSSSDALPPTSIQSALLSKVPSAAVSLHPSLSVQDTSRPSVPLHTSTVSTAGSQPTVGVGVGVAHHYKFSVDLRSIHNAALDNTIRCYLRYSYSFFGCPYPVVVRPPVHLSLNVDQPFSQSYCAFEFATEPEQLTRHICTNPLVVEVWQSCDKSHDLIIGTAKVALNEVLSGNKAWLEGGVTRQICSLRSPITPPPPSHHHALTLGHINTVLVLEDHGPLGPPSAGSALAPPTSLPTHLLGSDLATTGTTHPLPQQAYQVAPSTSNVGSSLALVHPHPPSLPPTLSSWTTSHVQHPPIWAPATTQNFSHSEPRSSSHLPPTGDALTFDRDNNRPHLPPSAAVDTRTFIGRPPPPPAPSGESFAVSENHGRPPTQQLLPPPTAGSMHHTTAASSVVVGSAEYDAAMELEMWKLAEEENFQERLKEREKIHMAKLGEEWQKREEQRQQLLRQKLEHYSSLERQLQEALQKVQAQQIQLGERETKYLREKDKLTQDRQLLRKEMEGAVLQVRTQYEQQLELERLRSSELQSHTESLKKQVCELESRLSARDTEFEKYRQQMIAKPESKLQAELSIAHLEKAELERKLLALSKSKQHYKDQWSKALGELAACRQREQAAVKERLLTQQKELEMMRARYLQHEEQNSIKQQLHQVKNEVEQLQEHTLTQAKHKPSSVSPSSKPNPSSTQDTGHIHGADQHTSPADTNVARWIEERDILLQTGVYSSNDPTIQKLDLKIRQALAKPSTSA